MGPDYLKNHFISLGLAHSTCASRGGLLQAPPARVFRLVGTGEELVGTGEESSLPLCLLYGTSPPPPSEVKLQPSCPSPRA